MTRLIFGCGYLGHRVARRWASQGDVAVVTRSHERARDFAAEGLRPIVADILKPETLADLPAADSVLFAVGFDAHQQRSIDEVYVGGLRNALAALSAATGRLIYISSTGVYGDSAGAWVDEDSPCEPVRAGGRACLAAERLLAAHALGRRSIVLRLAGIYGPGRIPRKAALAAGEPIAAPANGWLNLIHVDDAVEIVMAAEQGAETPRVYCVSDGHPVERRLYYEELARLVGAAPPAFAAADAGSAAAGRAAFDKRVSNRRLCAELRPRFNFPSYREGLAAIVAEQ